MATRSTKMNANISSGYSTGSEGASGLRNFSGKQVVIGIRPEDFEDAAIATSIPETSRLTSTVSLIEALGSELMVHFSLDARRVDSGDPDAVEESGSSAAVGRFNPRSRARMGDQISIAVATENMHFFDPASRLAIWE